MVKDNGDNLDFFLEFAEQEVARCEWTILGWSKASTSADDGSFRTTKLHIVSMKTSDPILKYVKATAVLCLFIRFNKSSLKCIRR
jgi:hypothetical protein